MFSEETKQVVADLLRLFARTSRIPIEVSLFFNGQEIERINSGEELYSAYCHHIWRLRGTTGYEMCVADMKRRGKSALETGSAEVSICHAGLRNVAIPIPLDGQYTAVMRYGSILPADTPVHSLSEIASQVGGRLSLSREETAELAQSLEAMPRGNEDDLKWIREILPQIIKKILVKFAIEADTERRLQRDAYHDLQISLQQWLSLGESLLYDFNLGESVWGKAKELVNSVELVQLTLMNLTSGRFLPERYTFTRQTLSHVALTAGSICEGFAKSREVGIRYRFTPVEDPVYIEISESHLHHAFLNLIHNAVKYSFRTTSTSDPRFIHVRGKVARNGDRDGYEVSITNYGVGIDEDEFDRIFRAGYRGRKALRENRTGTGQGLSLAREIIEKHQGSIDVLSIPQGTTAPIPYRTTFTVWLPLRQGKHVTHDAVRDVASSGASG